MRCFVIGNGPSLSKTPLDWLINEVTFATNRIHLIYPQTMWRPTYYVRGESLADRENKKSLIAELKAHANTIEKCYINAGWQKFIDDPKVEYIKPCQHYQYHYNDPKAPHLWHLPYLCGYGSSLHIAIQLAYKMGYSPIYLLGCDLGYGEHSHFCKEYETGDEADPRIVNLDLLSAHMVAARSAKMAGLEIYNATIGGELEVYERVNINDL